MAEKSEGRKQRFDVDQKKWVIPALLLLIICGILYSGVGDDTPKTFAASTPGTVSTLAVTQMFESGVDISKLVKVPYLDQQFTHDNQEYECGYLGVGPDNAIIVEQSAWDVIQVIYEANGVYGEALNNNRWGQEKLVNPDPDTDFLIPVVSLSDPMFYALNLGAKICTPVPPFVK